MHQMFSQRSVVMTFETSESVIVIRSHSYDFIQSVHTTLMVKFRDGLSFLLFSKNLMFVYLSHNTNSFEITTL